MMDHKDGKQEDLTLQSEKEMADAHFDNDVEKSINADEENTGEIPDGGLEACIVWLFLCKIFSINMQYIFSQLS